MPNTVVKLTNAESTWLEAAREDRKLLINMKAHLQRCAFLLLLKDICKDVLFALPSFGSWFRVQGSGLMSSPLEKGRAKGAGWIHESGVKNYVRLSVFLKRHPDRSGGILPADR